MTEAVGGAQGSETRGDEAPGAGGSHGGFSGAAGRTRSVATTIWCAGCGTWFGGRWWAALDTTTDGDRLEALLDHGFGGINRNHCPACSASYVVLEPLVVHRPLDEQLLVVVPNRRMHRAQHARAATIAAVADDPGPVLPAYAREPILVAGVSGLRGLIGEVTRVSARPSAAGADEVKAPAADVGRDESPTPSTGSLDATGPHTVPGIDLGLESGATTQVGPLRDAAEPSSDITAQVEPIGDPASDAQARPAGLLAALMAEAEPEVVEDRTGPWHDDWALDGEPEAPVEHEPTRVSRMVAPRARLPEGEATRLVLDDGDVIALYRVPSAAAADAALTDDAELRFQLHVTPQGPALCLTLVEPGDADSVCWPLDPDAEATVLDHLQRRFVLAVEAVDGEGALVGRRVFDPPLARNVALARERVERAGGSPAAAQALVASIAYDRLGQLRHNFSEHAFAACRSAAEAHLALGIVGFWSEPEREAYLVDVQSFPRVWFEAIVRRVLSAALDFGLMPPTHLEERAIAAGLAGDARGLLGRALGAFAELNLSTSIKANDLDPIDNYENWERLLTRAEVLGIAVDAGLRGLALSAMEAARRAADALDASEDPIELDLDDDLIELESVDDVFAESSDGAEVTEPLTDFIDSALVGLLADPARRVSAAAVLVQRGDTEHGAALADALGRMAGDELVRVLPLGLPQIAVLAPELDAALRSPDPIVRRAITLFLAEGRRPEAILTLVDQLLDARDGGWTALAHALAGYGTDVRHLVAGMPLDGDGLERVARVLASMPTGLRDAVYDAGARRSTRVQRCIERAERLAESEPGPSSFAHRLEAALSMLAEGDTRGPTPGVSGGGDDDPRFG